MFALDLAKDEPLTEEDWRSRVHPEDLPYLLDDLKASTNYGQPYSHAFRVQLPDGSSRHIIGVGTVLQDDAGQSKKMIGLKHWSEVDPNAQTDFCLAHHRASESGGERERT